MKRFVKAVATGGPRDPPMARRNRRDRIIALVAEGISAVSIAERLGVTAGTVRKYQRDRRESVEAPLGNEE